MPKFLGYTLLVFLGLPWLIVTAVFVDFDAEKLAKLDFGLVQAPEVAPAPAIISNLASAPAPELALFWSLFKSEPALVQASNYTLTINKTGDAANFGTVSGGGLFCGSNCFKDFGIETAEVKLQVSAQSWKGAVFSGWGGDCAGFGKTVPCVLNIDGSKTALAEFSFEGPVLIRNVTGSGVGTVYIIEGTNFTSACGKHTSPCVNKFLAAKEITLVATPNIVSEFAGWTGDCESTGTHTDQYNYTWPSCTLLIDSPKTVNAEFALAPYSLSITEVGSIDGGSGTVKSDIAGTDGTGINCGTEGTGAADCLEDYDSTVDPPIEVTLTAVPGPNSIFAGWGDGVTALSRAFTMNSDKAVSAEFDVVKHNLILLARGNGGGYVADGLPCAVGKTCISTHLYGTEVILNAWPDENSVFAGWSQGGCSGTGSCVVTMDSNKTILAMFNLKQFHLTINKTGSGQGVVTGTGINCGSDCLEPYDINTQVELIAAPSDHSAFDHWLVDGNASVCPDAGKCVVTMNAAKTATAVFKLKKYTLTVYKPKFIGTRVVSDIGNINCFYKPPSYLCAEASAVLDYGSIVKLTAASELDPNIKFSAWSGDCTGTTKDCSLTIDSNKAVYANFSTKKLEIGANLEFVEGGQGWVGTAGVASPNVWGGITQYSRFLNGFLDESRYGVSSSLSIYNLSIYCRPESLSKAYPEFYADCYHNYDVGDTVLLMALPYTGSEFVGWSNCEKTGIYNGDVPTCAVTDPRVVKASFAPKPSLKPAYMWLEVDKAGSTGKGIITNKRKLLGIADSAQLTAPCMSWNYPCAGWDVVDLGTGEVSDYFGGPSGLPEDYLAVKESPSLSTPVLTESASGEMSTVPDPSWRGFYFDKNLTFATLREVFYGLPLDYVATLYAEPSLADGSVLDTWKGCNYVDNSFSPPACIVYPADQNLAYRKAYPYWDEDKGYYPSSCSELIGGYMAGKDCYFDGITYICGEPWESEYYYVGSESKCDSYYGDCYNGKEVACPYPPYIGGNCTLQYSAANICVVDVYETKKVSAVFKYPKRKLTIVNAGSGRGLVAGGQDGEIFCGLDCQEKFNNDTLVTLTAKPVEGSVLLEPAINGWKCVDSKLVYPPGGGPPTNYCLFYTRTVKMDADKTIKVYFNRATLNVIKDGTGTGRVAQYSKTHFDHNDGTGGFWTVSNPEFLTGGLLTLPDIDCGNDCAEDYKGVVKGVVLLAIASDDSYFAGWSGQVKSWLVGSTGDADIIINDTKTVNATFNLKPILTVVKTGDGAAQGLVIADVAATGERIINCGSACSHYASIGANIALLASAPPTYTVAWTGCVPDSVNPRACNLIMPPDSHTVTVTFTPPNVKTLTVVKGGTGDGLVSSSPAGIGCGADCSASFNQGTSVTLTAAPFNNAAVSWDGCTPTDDFLGCNLTMSDVDHIVTVTFTLPLLPTCTLIIEPSTVKGANSYELRWTTGNNPTSATIDNGVGAVDSSGGSEIISAPATAVSKTKTYTLTVSDSMGNSDTCSATVTVEPSLDESSDTSPGPPKFIWDKIKEVLPF